MNQHSTLKGFILGVAAAVLIIGLCVGVYADTTSKQATLYYRDIKITIDGEEADLVDVEGNEVEPFIIDNTVYLPVRVVANGMGLSVEWDDANSTVVLTSVDEETSVYVPFETAKKYTEITVHLPDVSVPTDSLDSSGTGDATLTGLTCDGPQAVTLTHSGSGDFSVRLINLTTGDDSDLLTGITGSYSGTVLIPRGGTYNLEITTDGDWTLESEDLDTTKMTSFYGSGDSVTSVFATPGVMWTISHTGSGSFSVIQWSADGSTSTLLYSGSGNYSNTVASDLTGDTFFQICSEGSWIITSAG